MTEERVLEKANETTNDLDSYYTIEADEKNGVLLTVHPAKGAGVSLKEMAVFEELNKRNVKNYNRSLILREIKEPSATPVKIADFVKEAIPEPEIQVTVARDRMEANLQLIMPKGCRPVTLEEMNEKIAKSGIVFGIDHEAVQKAFEHPGFRVVCAKGQTQIDGKDAFVKYHVDMDNKGRPVEHEDGKVDYKDLNIFTMVFQNDLLAEKVPATPGINGIDVLGQPVTAKPGKEINLPAGKNVQIVDQTIVAAISGQLLIQNNKVNVLPVIEIKEDVDLSTGNIEFVGSVIVKGSVQAGFTVKAEENVEVFGTVSGGVVEGKNVNIKMGIQGMHRGYVKATENVIAKFIENATVYAGQDVLVNDVILHSRINAGKKVVVEGRRGMIAGGTVMAGEEIRAKVVGTHMSIGTELEVGVNPMLREEYQNIRREIKKVEISLEQTQKALTILKAMDQTTMPQDRREMLLKLTKAQFHLVGQVETMRNRMNDIELAFEEMKYGRIKVGDVMFPGVKVVIGTLVKPIREALKFVSLYAEEGEIKVGTFK
jgi:uncharacterized protein (DUF342 family)